MHRLADMPDTKYSSSKTKFASITQPPISHPIPTRDNLFLPVRLLVWADERGTVAQADSATSAELQGAPRQELLQLKNIQKYHWVKHREMLICCLGVSP
jgi:hypothetical protein